MYLTVPRAADNNVPAATTTRARRGRTTVQGNPNIDVHTTPPVPQPHPAAPVIPVAISGRHATVEEIPDIEAPRTPPSPRHRSAAPLGSRPVTTEPMGDGTASFTPPITDVPTARPLGNARPFAAGGSHSQTPRAAGHTAAPNHPRTPRPTGRQPVPDTLERQFWRAQSADSPARSRGTPRTGRHSPRFRQVSTKHVGTRASQAKDVKTFFEEAAGMRTCIFCK